ncbi:MAG: nucleoside-diphosphate kinase [Candidatus Nanoarchaeia archaeon]|nr:nucleoside-diphosphate kinase [Candidatus Nanoarchaeia archaeon]
MITEEDSEERSLVMIKPEGVKAAGAILEQLDSLGGRRILTAKINPVPLEFIKELYLPIAGKDIYGPYVDWFRRKEVILSVYQGKGIIGKLRELIGATEPARAKPGTIRREFGGSDETYELARVEGRVIRNLVHGSDCKNAEREVDLARRTLVYAIDSLLSTPPASLLACPTFFINSGGIRFSYS